MVSLCPGTWKQGKLYLNKFCKLKIQTSLLLIEMEIMSHLKTHFASYYINKSSINHTKLVANLVGELFYVLTGKWWRGDLKEGPEYFC